MPTPQAVADALRVNHTVRTLDLSYTERGELLNNEYGDEGIKAGPFARAAAASRFVGVIMR